MNGREITNALMTFRGVSIDGNTLLEHGVHNAGQVEGTKAGSTQHHESSDAVIRHHQIGGAGSECRLSITKRRGSRDHAIHTDGERTAGGRPDRRERERR